VKDTVSGSTDFFDRVKHLRVELQDAGEKGKKTARRWDRFEKVFSQFSKTFWKKLKKREFLFA